jgi:glycosyltransferase involved in cell wall biosynthesis
MAKQSPKVGIGMPVYNMESTLQEAIDTVLNQTFSDFQLIISDNASDDGTEEICRAAAKQDSRVIYHRNTVNILAENFHLAFLLSKGKYFMWAAADDARRPEMVARCVEALEADTEAVLAYTHTELLDPATGTRRKYSDSYRLDQEGLAERYASLIQSLRFLPLYCFYGCCVFSERCPSRESYSNSGNAIHPSTGKKQSVDR